MRIHVVHASVFNTGSLVKQETMCCDVGRDPIQCHKALKKKNNNMWDSGNEKKNNCIE